MPNPLPLQLIRPRLSALVAASALAGWALQPLPAGGWLAPALGVFLLAAGASALNQVQEQKTDALMARTAGRPLPTGHLQTGSAFLIALLFLTAGLAALAMAGWQPLLFGLLALACYNGVYTPLKQRTAFAVLPGALCGALPPVIGWTAAGGEPADFRCVLLAGLLFLWQVPHFWLYAEKHRDDYRRAGLPVATSLFSAPQVKRLLFVWSAALLFSALEIAIFALVSPEYLRSVVPLCSILFLIFSVQLCRRCHTTPPGSFAD